MSIFTQAALAFSLGTKHWESETHLTKKFNVEVSREPEEQPFLLETTM